MKCEPLAAPEVHRIVVHFIEHRIGFSPITHSHPIAQVGHLPVEWDYWEAYDKRLLAICDQLYVLTLDDWQESVGVAAEMKLARNMGKPIRYYDPERVINPK